MCNYQRMRCVRYAFALASAILAMASGATLAAPPPDVTSVFVIRTTGGMPGIEKNELMILSRSGGVWLAERRRRNASLRHGEISDHMWIDGRFCPALERAVRALKILPPPKSAQESIPAFDGVYVVARGPLSNAGAKARSVVRRGGPMSLLSKWRFETDGQLESCWRAEPVAIAGQVVAQNLAAESDVERWRVWVTGDR